MHRVRGAGAPRSSLVPPVSVPAACSSVDVATTLVDSNVEVVHLDEDDGDALLQSCDQVLVTMDARPLLAALPASATLTQQQATDLQEILASSLSRSLPYALAAARRKKPWSLVFTKVDMVPAPLPLTALAAQVAAHLASTVTPTVPIPLRLAQPFSAPAQRSSTLFYPPSPSLSLFVCLSLTCAARVGRTGNGVASPIFAAQRVSVYPPWPIVEADPTTHSTSGTPRVRLTPAAAAAARSLFYAFATVRRRSWLLGSEGLKRLSLASFGASASDKDREKVMRKAWQRHGQQPGAASADARLDGDRPTSRTPPPPPPPPPPPLTLDAFMSLLCLYAELDRVDTVWGMFYAMGRNVELGWADGSSAQVGLTRDGVSCLLSSSCLLHLSDVWHRARGDVDTAVSDPSDPSWWQVDTRVDAALLVPLLPTSHPTVTLPESVSLQYWLSLFIAMGRLVPRRLHNLLRSLGVRYGVVPSAVEEWTVPSLHITFLCADPQFRHFLLQSLGACPTLLDESSAQRHSIAVTVWREVEDDGVRGSGFCFTRPSYPALPLVLTLTVVDGPEGLSDSLCDAQWLLSLDAMMIIEGQQGGEATAARRGGTTEDPADSASQSIARRVVSAIASSPFLSPRMSSIPIRRIVSVGERGEEVQGREAAAGHVAGNSVEFTSPLPHALAASLALPALPVDLGESESVIDMVRLSIEMIERERDRVRADPPRDGEAAHVDASTTTTFALPSLSPSLVVLSLLLVAGGAVGWLMVKRNRR